MATAASTPDKPDRGKQHPFRRAVLRGLGVVLPPLLTIVVFLWAWTIIESYVLVPLESAAQHTIEWSIRDIHSEIPSDVRLDHITAKRNGQVVPIRQLIEGPIPEHRYLDDRIAATGGQIVSFQRNGRAYVPVGNDEWIPQAVFNRVKQDPGGLLLSSATGEDYYLRYARIEYLQRWRVIPVFLVLFIGLLYILGKFLAAGVGRMTWSFFESLIHRLPIIRNVYGSVKQVTDFLFSEREIEFNRVVAVQYPRKGIWTVAFVTGEGMLDVRSAANEPVLTVLIPTSPMPATGFTVTVLRSETVDLNISLDQAIQYIVSCGVVVPLHQQYRERVVDQQIASTLSAAVAAHASNNGQFDASKPDQVEQP